MADESFKPFKEGDNLSQLFSAKFLNALLRKLTEKITTSSDLVMEETYGSLQLGLASRIDNFEIVELKETLDGLGSAEARILKKTEADGIELIENDSMDITVEDITGTSTPSGTRGVAYSANYTDIKRWFFFPAGASSSIKLARVIASTSGDAPGATEGLPYKPLGTAVNQEFDGGELECQSIDPTTGALTGLSEVVSAFNGTAQHIPVGVICLVFTFGGVSVAYPFGPATATHGVGVRTSSGSTLAIGTDINMQYPGGGVGATWESFDFLSAYASVTDDGIVFNRPGVYQYEWYVNVTGPTQSGDYGRDIIGFQPVLVNGTAGAFFSLQSYITFLYPLNGNSFAELTDASAGHTHTITIDLPTEDFDNQRYCCSGAGVINLLALTPGATCKLTLQPASFDETTGKVIGDYTASNCALKVHAVGGGDGATQATNPWK